MGIKTPSAGEKKGPPSLLLSALPPLPKLDEILEPSGSRPIPARTGIGTVSSNGASSCGEQVARKHSDERPQPPAPPHLKSLYESARTGASPPPQSQSDQGIPSQDQDAQVETAVNADPEPAAPGPFPGRVHGVLRALSGGLFWPFPPGYVPQLGSRRTLSKRTRPERRALLISNNEPFGHQNRLRFAEADVERFENCLITLGFENGKIRTIKAEGNREIIVAAFNTFFADVIAGDNLVLFISAHAGYERDGFVYFMNYNAPKFSIKINELPDGCHLEMFIETCHSTELAWLPYPIKEIRARNIVIGMPSCIPMGASFPVAAAPPPSGAGGSHSGPAPIHPGSTPGTQRHHHLTYTRSRHTSFGLATATGPLADSVPTPRPTHSSRRHGGADPSVVEGSLLSQFVLMGPNTKATVTLWAASSFFAYEAYGDQARNSVVANAFCEAIEKGLRRRGEIWEVIELMTRRENEAREKRDRDKTPKELAKLLKDGPRDQCPHLRSTCNDRDRILMGEVFRALPEA